MQDALKLAEAALEMAAEQFGALSEWHHAHQCNTAFTAIRAARADWGWRPIGEMEAEEENPVYCAVFDGQFSGVSRFTRSNRAAAVREGYTHFYRPQLPPPPTREER